MILLNGLKKSFPLGINSLVFQICFVFFLFTIVSFLGWSKISFFAGLSFAYIYTVLFFYSIKLMFLHGQRRKGAILLGVKWLLLFLALMTMNLFMDGRSFLIGLSYVISFWFCYVLETFKK